MQRRIKILSALLVSIGLVACSGPSHQYSDPRIPQVLEIEILDNNSKMFTYRVGVPVDQQRDRTHIARSGSSDREGGRDGERGFISISRNATEHLEERVGYVVKQMNYCREGFLTIDSSLSPMHAWMKGECKEDATEEDRKNFGAKKVLPVKL